MELRSGQCMVTSLLNHSRPLFHRWHASRSSRVRRYVLTSWRRSLKRAKGNVNGVKARQYPDAYKACIPDASIDHGYVRSGVGLARYDHDHDYGLRCETRDVRHET